MENARWVHTIRDSNYRLGNFYLFLISPGSEIYISQNAYLVETVYAFGPRYYADWFLLRMLPGRLILRLLL